jgi:LacI family transcriptional regulator
MARNFNNLKIYKSIAATLEKVSCKREDLIKNALISLKLSKEELSDRSVGSLNNKLRSRIGAIVTKMLDEGLIFEDAEGYYSLTDERPAVIRLDRCEKEIVKALSEGNLTKKALRARLIGAFGADKTATLKDDETLSLYMSRILKHLISLGSFRSFAFLPERANPHWSTIRMRTFCKELKRKGRTCLTFESYAPDETRYRTDLAAWLTSLPKPAALFCAWDSCAITAATVCSECRISIPEQISILGVDDDEFLCNLVSPPLSSIRPDFEGEGFLAAKMLDQMMNSKGMTRPKLMSCKVDGVTERGSTHPLSPSGFLVQRALDFIDDNVCRGITVPDVVDHLGVSRSLLSLRFRQIQRESILQTIRTRRMREVKRLLSSTAYPIARIISMCGFRSENSPKNLFRKMFGMTMSEYRRRHHAETAKHTFR